MSLLGDYLLKELKAEHLTRESAPGLYQSMDRIAEMLGSKTPEVHLIPPNGHPHPMLSALSRSPNAASISSDGIIVTKPLLKLFESVDLTRPISKEMEAVMAHEMHHCNNRTRVMLISRAPIFALPLAAMTGLYLYDKANAKARAEKDTSPENVAKNIESAAKETAAGLPAQSKGEPDPMSSSLKFAKYMAVAAVGLGLGLYAARHGARFEEFAADRFAAKAVGKETMVNALRKIHTAAGASVSEHVKAEKFKGILEETLMAHPTFAERAAHIRSV